MLSLCPVLWCRSFEPGSCSNSNSNGRWSGAPLSDHWDRHALEHRQSLPLRMHHSRPHSCTHPSSFVLHRCPLCARLLWLPGSCLLSQPCVSPSPLCTKLCRQPFFGPFAHLPCARKHRGAHDDTVKREKKRLQTSDVRLRRKGTNVEPHNREKDPEGGRLLHFSIVRKMPL